MSDTGEKRNLSPLALSILARLNVTPIKSPGKKTRVAIRDNNTGELLSANATADSWQRRAAEPRPPQWLRSGNVMLVTKQICACCGGEGQYVTCLTSWRDHANHATKWERGPHDDSLPTTVEYRADEHVARCPACLTVSERIDSIFEQWLADMTESPQLRLF